LLEGRNEMVEIETKIRQFVQDRVVTVVGFAGLERRDGPPSLNPRGRRQNLDFCNATCFGLHGISPDHAWFSWGRFWIKNWVKGDQNPGERKRIRRKQLLRGATPGDSTARYEFIR
jgi:hypothetical protein